MVPYRKPVFVVVGQPMKCAKIDNPNKEQIAAVHAQYIKELTRLFDKYKHQYMSADVQLIIE